MKRDITEAIALTLLDSGMMHPIDYSHLVEIFFEFKRGKVSLQCFEANTEGYLAITTNTH